MAPPPEIGIPSTSVGRIGSSKPFTLYNITLRLPLRSYVVQKRYSDFSRLHATLTEQVGAPPPEPLPGKHWLKSTVTSPQLAEQRRVGLERYLRVIAESPDRRWRDTAGWRGFLNLPNSSGSSAVSAGGTVGNAAAGAADPHTWLDVQRELKGCLQDARQSLSRRDGALDSADSSAAIEAGASAKRALVKSGTLIITLTDGLAKMQKTKRVGEGELRRRRDLVAAARMERDGLEKLASSTPSSSSAAAADEAELLRGAGASSSRAGSGGRVLGAPLPETNKTRELDNQGVLQLQRQELEQQDMDVSQLAAVIRRQRELGIQIGEEAERQKEMLDMLGDDTDRVQGKVRVGNARLKKF
ncbi:regulator of vacuolar morphogenesis [Geosmithia morbida]|uniref:Regulator of vacuolar morphogenesis n=1 Tax=Geosmithia morbida TaxID=1094350 RepID=A0A9P5CXI0_9HYPO|nr:regulator of vacuolar morphogenesis [Geosmithia morbida]KAF4119298.1 regulator of vacuolar morphogenesis [Geosmithia morbida]